MVFGWDDLAYMAGGALMSNQRNAAAQGASDHQMDFQREMRESAHQTEVKDLRAAGLNPILSAGGTGAAMAQGSTWAPETSTAVSTGLQYKQLKAAGEKVDSDIQVNDSMKGKLAADTAKTNADEKVSKQNEKLLNLQIPEAAARANNWLNNGEENLKAENFQKQAAPYLDVIKTLLGGVNTGVNVRDSMKNPIPQLKKGQMLLNRNTGEILQEKK